MNNSKIREKILKHLNGLNELERRQGSKALIDTLANRYDVPRNVVIQAIAEWSSGHEKVDTPPQ
ncbi:MAG: hypothetical protein ACLFR0_08340 [Alphaproteobacteria bacterium]